MSDRDDFEPLDEKNNTSNFTVIDEADEKPKGKAKPKRRYLPDHLVINTKLVVGVLIVLVFTGAFLTITRSAPVSQSVPMILRQVITATPQDSLAPFPTATYPYVIIPTPTMRFDSQFRNWTYPVILTREIGGVPANTRVTIHSGYFNGTEWIYTVTPEMGGYLDAVPESALMAAADLGTQVFVTPGALFNELIGMNVYWAITTDQVGDIPRNTLVRISSAFYEGTKWVYDVATEGDLVFAQAQEWQLAFAPGVTPGAPTPVGN